MGRRWVWLAVPLLAVPLTPSQVLAVDPPSPAPDLLTQTTTTASGLLNQTTTTVVGVANSLLGGQPSPTPAPVPRPPSPPAAAPTPSPAPSTSGRGASPARQHALATLASPAASPWYGVLQPDGTHAAAEITAGVTVASLELGWDQYEPASGSVSATYVNAMKSRLSTLRTAGQRVVLDAGLQYPPPWVFALDANTRFVNQYGDVWHGGTGQDAANAVFDQAVRNAQQSYLNQIFQDFGDVFFAVRVGGLGFNELRYPQPEFNGHTNSYWVFDRGAQAQTPVAGWKPGDPDTTKAGPFLSFYLQALQNYQSWQLSLYRSHFSGLLEVLYPSWGLRPGDIDAAVADGLNGTSLGEQRDEPQQGLDWAGQVAAITDTHAAAYGTWLERADDGTTTATMSPIRYLASLAQPRGVALAGENSGNNTVADLATCISRVQELSMAGMMWFAEPQLVGGGPPSLTDYGHLNGFLKLLTTTVSGSGTVASVPPGIACPPTCTAGFPTGGSVSLTAVSGVGNTFAGWGGDCTGTGTCALIMAADHSMTAAFSGIPPGAPLNVIAGAGDTAAVVSFSPPASSGSSAISSYTVTTNAPVGGARPAPVSVAAGCTPCQATITGLSDSLGVTGHPGYTFTVTAANGSGPGPGTTTGAVYPQVVRGQFHPLPPTRILDTRTNSSASPPEPIGSCSPSPCATLDASNGGRDPITVQVAGQGGVPATGVSAVVMNVTVVSPASNPGSYLTIYPAGTARPNASNLNFGPGQIVPNLVTAPVGTNGAVNVFTKNGTVDVIADVAGWYSDGMAPPGAALATAASRYTPLPPTRILDTRNNPSASPAEPIGSCTPSPCAALDASGAGHDPITLQVAGQGGVPATGVAAVVMNVTVVSPQGNPGSYLTLYPSGTARPNASNLNFGSGQVVPNLVTVQLGANGAVDVFTKNGTVDVIADVAGWYAAPGSLGGSLFTPVSPVRLLDTRNNPSASPPVPIGSCTPSPCATLDASNPSHDPIAFQVAGQGGVPGTGAAAAVMNVTVVPSPSNPQSYLTVYPSGTAVPNASNLNFGPGQVVPNLVTVQLGSNGAANVVASSGLVDVIADLAGWFNDGSS